MPKVTHTATAWEAIGWDDGEFRIRGGRSTYEAVMYNCATGGRMVLLARLESTAEGLRQVNRYVEPETVLEFFNVDPATAEEFNSGALKAAT